MWQSWRSRRSGPAPPPRPTRSGRSCRWAWLCKWNKALQPEAPPAATRLRLPAPPGSKERSRARRADGLGFPHSLQAALRGLVLSGVELPAAWERVLRLDFGVRPGDPPQQRLHCEIMGRYSNVVLTDGAGTVTAAGYQVRGRLAGAGAAG